MVLKWMDGGIDRVSGLMGDNIPNLVSSSP